MIAAGPFARTARPRKKPKRMRASHGVRGSIGRVFVAGEAEDDGGADHGNCEHAAERHVGGGGVREADHADCRGEKQKQPARGFGAVETQCQPRQRERRKQRGNRARQARRGFAHAKKFEGKRGAPIKERRLFKPRLSVQPRRDPIAGLGHVARNPRVARLVGADKSNRSEMAEITNVQRCDDENGPADAGYRAGLRFLSDGSRRFAHGRESLALKLYLRSGHLLHTVARRPLAAVLAT